jgi:cytosine/adenosine deaminase-related metal-dependent hydrolase
LHAALTLSDATLEKAREARAKANLPGFHVHVAESKFDLKAVERLAKLGILGPGSIAAHCVHVDDRERALLAETRTLVVTNPSSNRNNAVGRSPVAAHLKSGVKVAIGSDGMTPDVLHELEQLFLSSKDAGLDPRAGWDEAGRALAGTKDVAGALFPNARLGSLVAGGPADVTVLEYVPWTPFESGNWLGHVLYGALGARVRHTVCGGRFVLRDFELDPALDVDRLHARARERARSLWSRRPLPERS